MSIAKQRHVCERCGFEWHTRTSGVQDELVEYIHAYAEMRASYRGHIASLKARIRELEAEVHSITAEANALAIAEAELRLSEGVVF